MLGIKIDKEEHVKNKKIKKLVGRTICMDLGQIGSSILKVLKYDTATKTVYLKYDHTGKEITLNRDTVLEQM